MPNPVKKMVLTLLVIIACLISFSGGLAVFFFSSMGREFVLEQVNGKIPGRLTLETLDIGFFKGRVSLAGLCLQDPQGKLLARVDRLACLFSWSAVLTGQMHILKLDIDSPVLELTAAPDGSLNLGSALGDKTTSGKTHGTPFPVDLVVDTFTLRNGRLILSVPASDSKLFLAGVDIRITEADLRRPRAVLEIDIGQGRLEQAGQGIVLEPSRFQARLTDQDLSKIHARAAVSGVSLEVTGEILDFFSTPVLDLVLSSPGIDLEAVPLLEKTVQGRAGGRILVAGKGTRLDTLEAGIELDLDFDSLQGPGLTRPVSGTLRGTGKILGPLIAVDSIHAGFTGGRVQGAGTLDIRDMIVDAKLDAEIEDIGILALAADVRGAGRLDMDARLNGPVTFPEIRALATGSGLSVKGIALGDLAARVLLDRSGRITLEHARLSAGDCRLTASGWMDLSDRLAEGSGDFPLEMQARLENGSLADFLPETGLFGRVSGQGTVRGTLASPLAEARIRAEDLYYFPENKKSNRAGTGSPPTGKDGIRLGNLDLFAGVKENVLTLSRAFLTNGDSRIAGTGDLMFVPAKGGASSEMSPAVNLEFTGTDLGIQDFWSGGSGRLSLDGRITGRLDRPEGEIRLEGQDIRVQDRWISQVKVGMEVTPDQVRLTKARITTDPGGNVDIQGRVVLPEKELDLWVTAHAFDLGQIWNHKAVPLERGTADGNFDIQGAWDNPRVSGSLGIRDLVVGGQSFPAVDLDLGVRDRKISIEGTAGPRFKGVYDVSSREFAVDLFARDLKLSSYLRLAGLDGFSGVLTGKMQARGTMDAPEQTRVSVKLDELGISHDGTEVAAVKNASAVMENGLFRLVPASVVLGRSGRLEVEGSGGIQQELDMKVSGNIPLKILSPWIEAVTEPSGTVQVEGSITGPVSGPRVRADLRFEDLAMTLDPIGQRMENIQGHLCLSPQAVTVDHINGVLGHGRFAVEGTIGLGGKEIQDVDLSVSARQLPIAVPDTMDLTLNSDLKLTGTGKTLRLGGQVVLLEGLYYRDVDLNLVAAATRRTRRVEPMDTQALPEIFKTVDLDVQILRRQPLTVANNLTDLTVSPDFTLGGTAWTPVLSGRAQVETGVVRYHHTEFEVKKGVIDFINPYRTEMKIDIEGQVQIRDWRITLTVSGTPDDLDLTFSSDPAEAHADILSLIAFGKTTRELRLSDGGGRMAPEKILVSLMSDTLGKNIKDAAGLDYFEVRAEEETADAAAQVNVTLGADLSRQLSIRYGVDIRAGETLQRVTTTYKLLENVLLNGYQESGRVFGGELKYRLEFR